MTWTAPAITRVDEPLVASEREVLEGFLDWYRATLLTKCAGLSAEQLAERPISPSNLSLLGLVRHMAEVERGWFRRRFAAEDVGRLYINEEHPDADFDDAAAASAEADFATFTRELELCRAAAAGHQLDETFVHDRINKAIGLRWVYVHLIEEYARHCGHADFLRELIDGTTGS
jgi:hypothetical protein